MNSTNPFIYSDDNKRYHTLNYYNKSSFNSKVFKAVIDAALPVRIKTVQKARADASTVWAEAATSPKNRTVKSTTA